MEPTNDIYISMVKVLSELSVLRQKTLNYHWNVSGRSFYEYHLLYERLYGIVDGFIDRVAEQARAYGRAPGTFSIYLKMSSIQEDTYIPTPEEMINNLVTDFNTLKATIYQATEASEESGDLGVENLLGDIAESVNTAIYLLSSVGK